MRPYAFYLVDTLGLMDKDDVLRFFYLINHNLAKGINMGFHSHNNLQLSFSNCQALSAVESERTISFDSSVYGMGRGAGNLNTELIANYLNNHCGSNYMIEPILEVIDEHISKIKEKFDWGYSVPYYLAAINGCHPNYAAYLSNKNTLNVKSISNILHMIEPENRSLFNKRLIEEKYLEYQTHEVDDTEAINQIHQAIAGKNVLILAPGASLNDNCNQITSLAKDKECVVISVSFVPNFIDTNYVFLSNLKRYETTFNPTKKKINLITTSNIQVNETDNLTVNYSSLLNSEDAIRDNTSLMLLTLLTKLAPAKVYIAGMDGYEVHSTNYYQERLTMKHNAEQAHVLNAAISKRIEQLSHQLNIEFITPTLYVK